MKRFRLALVRQRYNPFGGAERFVERALAALADRQVSVTLLTRQWKGTGTERDVRILNPFFFGRRWRDASFAFAVQNVIAGGEFDLVQSHERIPGCSVYRAGDGVHATWLDLRARTQSGFSGWLTRRLPWHRYILRAEAQMFRHPSLRAVICNSHMVRDDIVRRFDVAAERLHVIHNGVDLDYFHPGLRDAHRQRQRQGLGIGADVPVVLFVGSGFERKGVPQLLQALARMKHSDAVAIVVGKDKKHRIMEGMAAELGLTHRVHFVGGQQDVRPWYGCADAFVLPTLYDPFPNAVLEALACGLPVVTSHSSGAAEVLNDACGAVCDALDVGALARHLDDLLDRDSRLLAEAARAAVATLDQADMGQRLIALYQGLLGEVETPPRL